MPGGQRDPIAMAQFRFMDKQQQVLPCVEYSCRQTVCYDAVVRWSEHIGDVISPDLIPVGQHIRRGSMISIAKSAAAGPGAEDLYFAMQSRESLSCS